MSKELVVVPKANQPFSSIASQLGDSAADLLQIDPPAHSYLTLNQRDNPDTEAKMGTFSYGRPAITIATAMSGAITVEAPRNESHFVIDPRFEHAMLYMVDGQIVRASEEYFRPWFEGGPIGMPKPPRESTGASLGYKFRLLGLDGSHEGAGLEYKGRSAGVRIFGNNFKLALRNQITENPDHCYAVIVLSIRSARNKFDPGSHVYFPHFEVVDWMSDSDAEGFFSNDELEAF